MVKISKRIAVRKLNSLIANRKQEFNNMPVFLEQERLNLQMEINDLVNHLQQIRGGTND